MVLNWNSAANEYEIVRRLPLVAMISPQFVRRRDDKWSTPNDSACSRSRDMSRSRLPIATPAS